MLARRRFCTCCCVRGSRRRYFTTSAVAHTQQKKDLYSVLHLGRNSTVKEVKASYYELSKKYHPDTQTVGSMDEAAEKFAEIAAAYEILGNEEKKSAYDRTLRGRYRTSYESSTQPSSSAGSRRSDIGRYWSETTSHCRPPPDFDMDYKNFVEFQRFYRKNKRFRNFRTDMPPEFGEAESRAYREYRSQFGTGSFHEQYRYGARAQGPNGRFYTEEDLGRMTELNQQELLKKANEERKRRMSMAPNVNEVINKEMELQKKQNEQQMKLFLGVVLFTAIATALTFQPPVPP